MPTIPLLKHNTKHMLKHLYQPDMVTDMGRPLKPTDEDVGAAMMAWYADSIKEHPGGLITQAQAAAILGVSRVATSRLVSRGYLRAVYFPKPPDIVGIAVGHDDPTWLKLIARLGDCDQTYAFPKACYVSFADVVDLWESGEARTKCKRDWNEIIANFRLGQKRIEELKKIQEEHKTEASRRRLTKSRPGSKET